MKNIFYITDIHIEDQCEILTYGAAEVDEQLDEKIPMMLEGGSFNDDSVLLIGGDTANSTLLFSKFHHHIEEAFPGTIAYVMGNHEHWLSRSKVVAGSLSPQQIAQRYRDDSGCIMLDSDLLLVYGGREHAILGAEEMLLMEDAELRSFIENARVAILGSTGYAACNPYFNAYTGMYDNAVSYTEEIMQGIAWLAIYEKVLSTAGDLPLVVLTHMPISDWRTEKPLYNPRWSYVNGHTHKNRVVRDERGEVFVFSDNQHGYIRRPWKLKEIVR